MTYDTDVVVKAGANININTKGTISGNPENKLIVKGVVALQPQSLPCYIDSTTMLWYKEGGVPDDAQDGYKSFSEDLTLKAGTTYTDDVFTYDRSGTGGKYLYTRVMQDMLFPPNLITIGTGGKAINASVENGIVYVGTYDTHKDLCAMVIYNIGTLNDPGVRYNEWRRDNIDSKFYGQSTVTKSISMAAIEGNMTFGYYISHSDYTGMSYTFYGDPDSVHYTGTSMTGYDAGNWKKLSDMDSDFVYDYMQAPHVRYTAWHQLGHIPSSIAWYSSVFRTLPDLVSGETDVYKDPGNTGTCYYISDGALKPTYYMALKIWSTETLPLPQEGDTITGEEDQMVYISTSTDARYKDLRAAVITSFTPSSLSFTPYSRPDTNSNFTASTTNISADIPLLSRDIGGSYYVPCSGTGLAVQLYDSNCIYDISSYDPLNWKKWEEVKDMFE
jgi:hypothetical protein